MGATPGMESFMNSINTGLSADNLWGAVATVAPLIITATLFAFGFGMFRRYQRKISKGKA